MAQTAIAYGADEVLHVDHAELKEFRPEPYTEALTQVVPALTEAPEHKL